jgi:hypothetical protein
VCRLPDSILKCEKLALCRLSDNDLEELPAGFPEELPNLAYVGLSGNPRLKFVRSSGSSTNDSGTPKSLIIELIRNALQMTQIVRIIRCVSVF